MQEELPGRERAAGMNMCGHVAIQSHRTVWRIRVQYLFLRILAFLALFSCCCYFYRTGPGPDLSWSLGTHESVDVQDR